MYSGSAEINIVNACYTDEAGAKAVAQRIFEVYDKDRNGIIDNNESGQMICDAYRSFNKVFKPTRGDVDSYLKIMDKNGDGKVTYHDIEDLCKKYLCPAPIDNRQQRLK